MTQIISAAVAVDRKPAAVFVAVAILAAVMVSLSCLAILAR